MIHPEVTLCKLTGRCNLNTNELVCTFILLCSFQISVMQQELVDLQPKLIETSRETEELIAIIEKETVEVEEKKKIVEEDEAVATEAANVAKAIKVRMANWEMAWLGEGLIGR